MVSDKTRALVEPLGGEKVYLDLAGDSSTAVTDKSANRLAVTLLASPTFDVPSPLGGQRFLTGVGGGQLDVTPSSVCNYSGAVSVNFWVRAISTDADFGCFYLVRLGPPDTGYIAIYTAGTTLKLDFAAKTLTTTIAAGNWYFVSMTYSHPNITLYINGVVVDTDTAATSQSYTYLSGDKINWGNFTGGDDTAYFAELIYYTRCLSAAEVRYLYRRASDMVNYVPWLLRNYWSLQTTPTFTTGWVDTVADLNKGDYISIEPMPGTAAPINLEEDKRRHEPKVQVDVWTNKGRAHADALMREVDRILLTYRRTPHHSEITRLQWGEPVDLGSERQNFQRYSFDVAGLRWSSQ